MKYKIGLDLGSTSLGWAVVELNENNDPIKLLDLGVRIFSDGQEHEKTSIKSLALVRSEAKSNRTQTDRKKRRKHQLLKILKENGLLPTDKILLQYYLSPVKGTENKTNPYYLRNIAVTTKIELYDLGRILWHLSKHRGFMGKRDQVIDSVECESNPKSKKSETDNQDTETNKRISILREDIKNANCITLGQYLYKRLLNHEPVRFKSLKPKSKEEETQQKNYIGGFPSRNLYQEEFDIIWNKQKQFYPTVLTDELKTKLCEHVIYYQRPLKFKEPGLCKFSNTRRIAKCQPLYQEFRILEDVNNLNLTNGENLLDEYRRAIYEMLMHPTDLKNEIDSQDKLPFDAIRRHLGLDAKFNFEDERRNGLLCNKTNLIMADKSLFGDEWFNFTPEKQFKIVNEITAYYKTKEDSISELNKLGITDTCLIQNLFKKQKQLTKGYSELSKETIETVRYDMLEKHKKWHEAAQIHFSHHTDIRPFNTFGYNPPKQLPDYRKLFPESLVNGKISNPTVHIGLNQLRKVINEIIKKQGCNPEIVSIEMAREIKMGQEALQKYKIGLTARQKDNAAARIFINTTLGNRSWNTPISPSEMERYKIWKNLHPANDLKKYDFYDPSDKPIISLAKALSSDYEIEHIIPRALGGDDGLFNKILTKKQYNLEKSNRIPSDYLSPQQLKRAQIWAKESDEARQKLTSKKTNKKNEFEYKSYAWRFEPDALKHVNTSFKPRDLNDTRYMCKLAKTYLSYICAGFSGDKMRLPNVYTNNGALTDLCKSLWELNEYLPKDYDKWPIQTWQKELMRRQLYQELSCSGEINPADKDSKKKIETELNNKTNEEFIEISSRKKDRSNHYHHALDAFVIACMDNIKFTHKINSMANEVESKRNEWNDQNPDPKDQKTLQEIRFELLKKDSYTSKPFANFEESLKEKLNNIVISEQQDCDKLQLYLCGKRKGFACLTEGTAYGLASSTITEKNSTIYITLQVNHSASDYGLLSLVPVFNKNNKNYKELKKQYIQAVTEYKREKSPETKTILENIISRKNIIKWLPSKNNYGIQIYTPDNGKNWKSDIMSNWWALQRKGVFWWRDIYTTGKLIMSLRIGSHVLVKKENAHDLCNDKNIGKWAKSEIDSGHDLIFRVKELSGGKIYLTPIHIAQQDNKTKSWQASARSLKDAKAEQVDISILGDKISLKQL